MAAKLLYCIFLMFLLVLASGCGEQSTDTVARVEDTAITYKEFGEFYRYYKPYENPAFERIADLTLKG
ncbi:MAG: hypothetical protein U5R06_10785 [candidate division KSB1 bacterium]|nr:hypothetical protein [candidate division KSB1 bacterium]